MLEAALLGTEIDSAVVLTKAGARVVLSLEKLSEADQSFLRAWQRERSPEAALPPVSWPGGVSAGPASISTPVQAEEGWGMDTVHYHFVCETELATAAVQELASAGEATHRWLKVWPLALPEPAEARSLARLFKTKASYTAAGDQRIRAASSQPPGAWGVCWCLMKVWGWNRILTALGIGKAPHFLPRTLVHEMTHQQMATVLPLLPLWLSEGLAELAALPEYRDGKFRVSRELMLGRLETTLGRLRNARSSHRS